jgi:hypothetical protein
MPEVRDQRFHVGDRWRGGGQRVTRNRYCGWEEVA